MAEVYATAGGPLARLAGPAAASARARRHARFFGLAQLPEGGTVLDVGCGVLGLRAQEPELAITGLDLAKRPTIQARSCALTPPTGCRSTTTRSISCTARASIEHVPPARRAAFAAELRRVGRGWFVQTPAFGFPLEPHSLLPGAHWLTPRLRRPYWRLGVTGGWEEISLLRRAELESLFGPALPERFGALVKSWVSVRPVRS